MSGRGRDDQREEPVDEPREEPLDEQREEPLMSTVIAAPRLVLRRGEDRRVRGGHPWIFSNEVESWLGSVEEGGMVDVNDYRGAFLGQAYVNRHSLICARLLTRGREDIDTALWTATATTCPSRC
jgi:hypothetical protein